MIVVTDWVGNLLTFRLPFSCWNCKISGVQYWTTNYTFSIRGT